MKVTKQERVTYEVTLDTPAVMLAKRSHLAEPVRVVVDSIAIYHSRRGGDSIGKPSLFLDGFRALADGKPGQRRVHWFQWVEEFEAIGNAGRLPQSVAAELRSLFETPAEWVTS